MPKPQHTGAGPSQRMLRVAELIRAAVSEILARGEINEPLLAGQVITVPVVQMSPDLKWATVFVMPLGGRDGAIVLKGLELHRKFLRGEIAHRIDLKFAPDLRFRMDESFEKSARIDALLHSPQVRRDLEGRRE